MKRNSNTSKCEKGVTLVELLVSLTVFLIGTAAVFGVMRLVTIQKNTVNARTDQLRSARIALEYIRRDTLNAGFGYHRTGGNIPDNVANGLFNLPADGDAQRDLMTSVMAGNNVNANTLTFGGRTDALTLICRDQTFNRDPVTNNSMLITYTGTVAAGSAINITTAPNACASCNKYDLYLLESASGTTQVIGMVTNKISSNLIQLSPGADDPFNLNQSATASGNDQSLFITTSGGGTIKRINLVSYSVTPDGVLVRRRFGNQTGSTAAQQIETRELVYGVSDFQIKYYMEDGTTVDDPSNGNDGRTNQMKLNSVVQVQVSITLAASANDSQPMVTTPVTLKEFISTKNLRYEAS